MNANIILLFYLLGGLVSIIFYTLKYSNVLNNYMHYRTNENLPYYEKKNIKSNMINFMLLLFIFWPLFAIVYLYKILKKKFK